MGFSRNPAVARKIISLMHGLTTGEQVKWTVQYGSADAWAFKCRQFRYILLNNPSEADFREFFPWIQTYAFTVLNPSTVVASQARAPVLPFAPGAVQPLAQAPDPGVAIAGRTTHSLHAPRSSFDILSFWRAAQPTNDMLSITDVSLSNAELEEVARALAAMPRPWMVLHPKGTATLILAPDDPQVPAEARLMPTPRRAYGTPLRDVTGHLIDPNAMPEPSVPVESEAFIPGPPNHKPKKDI